MHLPGEMRDEFHALLDSADGFVPPPIEDHAARAALGRVWCCTDPLSTAYCEQLDLENGSTYAQAAQLLARLARSAGLSVDLSGPQQAQESHPGHQVS